MSVNANEKCATWQKSAAGVDGTDGALREVRSMSESDSQPKEGTAGNQASVDTELKECVVCGAVGLPERSENHDCSDFFEFKGVGQ